MLFKFQVGGRVMMSCWSLTWKLEKSLFFFQANFGIKFSFSVLRLCCFITHGPHLIFSDDTARGHIIQIVLSICVATIRNTAAVWSRKESVLDLLESRNIERSYLEVCEKEPYHKLSVSISGHPHRCTCTDTTPLYKLNTVVFSQVDNLVGGQTAVEAGSHLKRVMIAVFRC